MKRVTGIVAIIATIAIFAAGADAKGPRSNYPDDLCGKQLTWQSRASMWLSEQCVQNNQTDVFEPCEKKHLVPGSVVLLGEAYRYGEDTIYVKFDDACEWDGNACNDLDVSTTFLEAVMLWNDRAGCYMSALELDESRAQFVSLTMTDGDAGRLQVGVFNIRANGRVYEYNNDSTRDIWTFNRWWPEQK